MQQLKAAVKKAIPSFIFDHYISYLDKKSGRPPLKIIEHMEVDFALSRLVDKKSLKVLDIGAHHGEFLDIFGTFNHWHEWDVYCVEPLDQNRKFLTTKSKKFRNVKVSILPVGISDVSEKKTFYLGETDTLFTCNAEWVQKFPADFAKQKQFEIRCLTVNDLSQEFGIPKLTKFDMVKIDVEGHDLNVIKSFCESSFNSTALIFEVSPAVTTIDECLSLLRRKGFKEFFIFGRTGIPTTHIGEIKDASQVQNLFESGKISVGNVVALSE